MDGIVEDPTQIQHFSFGDSCPGGGITKVADGEVIKTGGKGGVVLYLAVENLEETMAVSHTQWKGLRNADMWCRRLWPRVGRR